MYLTLICSSTSGDVSCEARFYSGRITISIHWRLTWEHLAHWGHWCGKCCCSDGILHSGTESLSWEMPEILKWLKQPNMQQPHLARTVIECGYGNQNKVMNILVASAITIKVSIHLNIMPMSVGGRGLSLAKGCRYGNVVYLIVRTALSCLPRLSRHSGQSSVEVPPSNPDMEDSQCYSGDCIPGSFWLCHNTLPWGVYTFL